MFPALRLRAAGLALIACGVAMAAAPQRQDLETLAAAERELARLAEADGGPEPRWAWVEAIARVAWAHAEAGDSGSAAAGYRRAIAALSGSAEDEDPAFVGLLHDGLGRALQNEGDLDAAEHHLRRAVHLRRDDAIGLGVSEGHLGLLQLVRGRYGEAETLLQSALAHTPADRDDLLAHRHDCLGRHALALRAYQRAADHFQDALGHASTFTKPGDPLQVDLRSNLALCRFRQGDAAGALDEIEALLVDPGRDPVRRLRHVGVLNLAATIHAALGQLAAAEKEIDRALAILSELKGGDHPSLAPVLANLGAVRHEAGDPGEALPPLRRARAILRKTVAEHHQTLVEVLYRIAACEIDLGRDATAPVDEARAAAHELMTALIAGGSERELLNFRRQVDLHSIVCRLGDPERIANSLLDGKGRIMEAVLDHRARSLELTRRLAGLQAELDRLVLGDPAAHRGRIDELRERIAGIARGFPAPPPADRKGRWQDIAERLPEATALVDFVRYRPADDAPPRYGAVVVTADGPPRWIPLAEEKLLGRLDLLHRSLALRAEVLRKGGGKAGIPMVPLLADLHRGFWQPVAQALPEGIDRVIACPEDRLHLLPFAVLRDPGGKFLCESLESLRIIDAGRRLLDAAPPAPDIGDAWMVLGVSDFASYRGRLARGGDLWAPRWREAIADVPDLPMVRAEIDSLRKLAPEGSIGLVDRQADEAALRGMSACPAVLHFASHGFHVPLSGNPDLSSDPSALYENGILLAIGGGDDGILFPEEAAALDLRGTLLVTLSTCRGALGRPVSGEGLLGLRRGFTKAGARHVLGSLWEIPDQSTAAFMRKYYASLRKDPRPERLLWRMQRERLTKLRDEDPDSGRTEEAILSFGGFVMTSP